MSIFQFENCLPFDGELYLQRAFYSPDQADTYFEKFVETLDWQQEQLRLYGRYISVPRLMAWYGDREAHYRYSGVDHVPKPWTQELLHVKIDLDALLKSNFNSVLANLYRDGRDSMGCHADNEPELGANPLIASLSFGETRLLRFRHQQTKHKFDIDLKHGDLLIMVGTLQEHWRHELPKTLSHKHARINLTYRQINCLQS